MVLRRQRSRQLPDTAARYERDLERWEGLAQYVEGKVAGRPRCLDTLAEPSRPDAIRTAAYATGEAIAVLMDEISPGWAITLDADDTIDLDDLLTSSVAGTRARADRSPHTPVCHNARYTLVPVTREMV